jgi:hypothetical protein
MIDVLERLLAHQLHAEEPLSLAWVPADEWQDVLLAIEWSGGEYAAFGVEHYGWVVVTTARLPGRTVHEIPQDQEHWLEEFWRKHASELMLRSPGWSDSPAEMELAAAGGW